jgi:hypothetical protein
MGVNYNNQSSNITAVIAHGFPGHSKSKMQRNVAELLYGAGYNTLAIDFKRDWDKWSELRKAKASPSELMQAFEDVEFNEQVEYAVDKINMYGGSNKLVCVAHSYGANIIFAALDKIKFEGVFSTNPMVEVNGFIRRRLGLIDSFPGVPKADESVDSLANYQGKVAIMYHRFDLINWPGSNARRLVGAREGIEEYVLGGLPSVKMHNFGDSKSKKVFHEILLKFFKEI